MRFWQGKKVLITGHTGFKGAWLSFWLKQLGAEVTGYGLVPNTSPSLFDALKLDQSIQSIFGDVRDLPALQQVVQAVEPEVVFHLAAQALVKPSYETPVDTFQTNIMGTVNILEAVRHQASVKAVVVITSDKCYENHESTTPYKESDRLGGHDPYSNSKACAELVTDSYRKSFFSDGSVAVATARAGNVIGGGDWSAFRLIPDVVRAQQSGQAMAVRNPNAIRPWQHVLEPLSGYLMLAKALVKKGQAYAQAWNFGPNTEGMESVQYLVEKATEKWTDFDWFTQSQPDHHEAQILMLDCLSVRQKLGWQPTWSIGTSLDMTLDWYTAYYAGEDMRAVCLHQIQQFELREQQQAV